MKRYFNYLKLFVFLLCTIGLNPVVYGQFVNGDFAAPGTPGCSGGTGWTTNPSPNYAQYVTSLNPNPWIDLTPCNWSGNGTWVEQTINTTPGELYFIRFDLGTWAVWGFDAGVLIGINGTQLGGRIFHSNVAPSGMPGWLRMSSCIFRATGPATTVRITGDGRLLSNPTDPNVTPGVIGLDNVELYRLNRYLSITDDKTPCNNHCFGLLDSLSQDTLAHSMSNYEWYVDGVLEGTDSTFCYNFPKNTMKEVMLIFDVTDACGTHADTLRKTITSGECCNVASAVSIMSTPINCNSYHFDLNLLPGNVLDNTQWTVNGAPVAGMPTSLDILSYGPGTYTICAIVTIHIDGEDETCTDTICTTITITYTTLTQPDVFLHTCTSSASYTPGCSYPYTSYRLTGAASYSQSGPLPASALSLPPGNYVLECYDNVNCIISVTNVYVISGPSITYCDVYLTNCSPLGSTYPGAEIMAQVTQNCPECASTLMSLSSVSTWQHVSHDPNTGQLVVKREYTSASTCRKCIITYHISNQFIPTLNLSSGGLPCRTITNSMLNPCLRNKPLKKYLMGHADHEVSVNPNVGIELCCANEDGVGNPTYYLYDPANPCCAMRITLMCVAGKQTPDDLGVAPLNSVDGAGSLSIQPNPTASVFRIASGKGERYERVDVVDMSGRVVLTKNDVDATTTFDVSGFAAGSYIVKVKTATGVTVLKLERFNK